MDKQDAYREISEKYDLQLSIVEAYGDSLREHIRYVQEAGQVERESEN